MRGIYIRRDGDIINFKSKNERSLAVIFDILNLNWKYEPFKAINGYLPDFEIILLDKKVYLEYHALSDKDKIKRVRDSLLKVVWVNHPCVYLERFNSCSEFNKEQRLNYDEEQYFMSKIQEG